MRAAGDTVAEIGARAVEGRAQERALSGAQGRQPSSERAFHRRDEPQQLDLVVIVARGRHAYTVTG